MQIVIEITKDSEDGRKKADVLKRVVIECPKGLQEKDISAAKHELAKAMREIKKGARA
jgi:hypothetical protein